MNWTENLKALAELSGESANEDDPDFLALMPTVIAAAENRILRDLDLLATRVTDNTAKLTQNSKLLVLPNDVGTFIVTEQVRVILPQPGGGGTGIFGPPLLWVSKDALDSLWPSEIAPSSPSVPNMCCPIDQATVGVAPAPDMDYGVSVYGTMRPAPLNPRTPDPGTFISTQMRDLFIAGEMLYISASQRNWSAYADDPQASASWTAEYERLMKAALVEELRKKLQSQGWGSRLPSPIATPPQT